MLTPAQLRAGRALLAWSRDDLAKKSGIAAETVKGFELRGSDSKLSTLQKWRRALEAAGVIFLGADDGAGSGVRLKSDTKATAARVGKPRSRKASSRRSRRGTCSKLAY